MSGNTWFAVENSLVDRTDLTLIEKMCCVVLARYAGRQEFSHMLNTHVVAIRMGCSVAEAESAIHSLMNKGLIQLENLEQIEPDRIFPDAKAPEAPKKVVKAVDVPKLESGVDHKSWLTLELGDDEDEQAPVDQDQEDLAPVDQDQEDLAQAVLVQADLEQEVQEVQKDPVVTPKIKAVPKAESPQGAPTSKRPEPPKNIKVEMDSLVEQVYEIIDENINDREARIILSFANNNIELIREKYRIAKKAQVKDKIEVLINELQKKEPPVKRVRAVEQVDEEAAAEPRANQQINLSQINSMAAFKQSAYGKKTQK